MSNNSKEFYLLCKNEGISKLDSKADIARIFLVAENNMISGAEQDLIQMYNNGKKEYKQYKANERKKEHIANIEEIRQNEMLRAEQACKFSSYIGRDTPIAICDEKLEEVRKQKNNFKEQREALLKTGVALYKAGKIKEKDWAIHGGIASGIAGGAAGLATALDIQQQNAQTREHNKQLMDATTSMISGGYWGTYAEEEKLDRIYSELRVERHGNERRLVEMLSPIELLEKLKPELVSKRLTETGAVELMIKVQPTQNLFVYENVPAVVDGAFYAVLIDGEDIVDSVCFSLPYKGSISQNDFVSYCFRVSEEIAKR